MSSLAATRPSARRTATILAVLFLATLGLRLRGLDWMLPCLVEPDVHLAVQLDDFRSGREVPPQDVHHAKYPHLLSRMLQPLPALGGGARGEDSPDVATHLHRAAGAILEVRRLVAVLSAVMVPLTFLLARRFLKTRWALLAAALVAVGPLHQHFAQQARPHGGSATLALLAVLACLRLRERPTFGSYTLAGIAAALAVGSLHSGVAVLIPLAAAHLLARGPRGPARRFAGPLCAAVPIVLGVVACYPFLFEHVSGGMGPGFDWSAGGLSQSAHKVAWSNFDGEGFARVVGFLWSYEPTVLVLGVAGAILWLARARGASRAESRTRLPDLLVVLTYAIPYLIAIGMYALTFQRFLIPLLPFAACCAAFAVGCVVDGAWSARVPAALRTALGVVLAGAALYWPARVTWRLGTLREAPSTLELAAAWIAEHSAPPKPRVIVSPGIDLPLPRVPDAVLADAALPHGIRPEPWIDYQAALLEARGPRHPLFVAGYPAYRVAVRGQRDVRRLKRRGEDWLQEFGGAWLVVPVVEKERNLVAWLLRQEAIRTGSLAARFSPEPDPALIEYPFMYIEAPKSDPMPFGARTLRVDAVGPTVEIYRLSVAGGD